MEFNKLTQVGTNRQRESRARRKTYTISVDLQLNRVVDSVESNSMQQRSNSSVCVFPESQLLVTGKAKSSLPVCRGSSGNSLFIGNDGFIKVLLAQDTGFLVSFHCVGTGFQLCTWTRLAKLTRRSQCRYHHRCIATNHLID